MLPTSKDLVLPSKQSLDCRAIENLGTEGANLNPKSNSELTSISNTVPSFGNDSPFSKPTGPSEFLPLPLELQPASCSSNRNETSLAELGGVDLTLPPNSVPSAQEPNQSEISPTGGPTESPPFPQAPMPNNSNVLNDYSGSNRYETKTGESGLGGADLNLPPNNVPSAQGLNQSALSPPDGPTEFFPLPQAPVLNDSGSCRSETKTRETGPEGVDLTHPPKIAPSAQGPHPSEFSPTGGPTEFIPLPLEPHSNNSGKYETETGVTGLLPNMTPSIQESNNSCVAPPLNSQGKSLEVEQLTNWSETLGEVSSHNSTPTPNRQQKSLNATHLTPKSEPARTVIPQHCGQCKNCLRYGGNVRNCTGLPTQSPDRNTRSHCGHCQNCLTYGDNVLNCRGPPIRRLTHPQLAPDYTSDPRNVQCYWCHHFGHYASQCTTNARPETRHKPSFLPRCGRCKNCLKHGENVLNCRGPPTQSYNHKTRPRCHRCQNCLTYGDNVRNCKGLPSRNLKPTSSGPANNNAIPKGTTTASPTPLTPTFLEHQVKTTLSNNEPAYTNHDRAINTFAKRDRRVTLSDDLSVIPNETPSVHTSKPPEVSPNNSHPTLDKTNTSELTPNSQPARPKTQQNCGHCQNCLRYGDNVRDCKGLPTQNLKPASTRPPTPHTPSKTS